MYGELMGRRKWAGGCDYIKRGRRREKVDVEREGGQRHVAMWGQRTDQGCLRVLYC